MKILLQPRTFNHDADLVAQALSSTLKIIHLVSTAFVIPSPFHFHSKLISNRFFDVFKF